MDLDQYIRFSIALLFVIALIVAVAWLMRRMGLGGVTTGIARHRRLNVVEVLPLDAKRRLLLVRCDDREHLVLLGSTGDLLMDSMRAEEFRSALAQAGHNPAGPDHNGGDHQTPGAAP